MMRKYLSILIGLILLSSCESELKINSPSSLTYAGFWDDESGAQAAHTGLYGAFRSQATNIWLLGEIRSDAWGGQTFESPSYESLYKNQITVSTAPFTPWGAFYGRIHQVNDFLENVPNVEFANEDEKNHFIGEAYGIRAFYYYTLLKTWGTVPISKETFVSEGDLDLSSLEGLKRPRSSEKEVIDFIKEDIERSLEAFGDDDSFWSGSRNYWSKAATLALKGDVYIWSGNLLDGGEADFQTAKGALEEISQIGSIGLVDNFEDLWGSRNEDNMEFIFTLQYEEGEASNMFNSFTGRSTEIHPQYNAQGESMDGMIINGGNRFGASDKTLLALDDNKDSRKNATFITLYPDNNGGAGYPSFNKDKFFGSILNKFLGRVDGSERIFDSDLPIYRYADVILMLAEAKNSLNEDPSEEINMIRERAYGSNYNSSIAYSNQSKEANTEAILQERYKEFVAEGKRWWDLRRAGDKYVIEHVPYFEPGEEYKVLLPISNDMIGSNPDLKQTPGWN